MATGELTTTAWLLLSVGLLMALSVLLSRAFSRFGLPVFLLFLTVVSPAQQDRRALRPQVGEDAVEDQAQQLADRTQERHPRAAGGGDRRGGRLQKTPYLQVGLR